KVVDDCSAENGVKTEDLTSDLIMGKIKPENVKQHIKCTIKCAYMKFGFMDDKANLLNDKLLQYFIGDDVKSRVRKVLDTCGTIVGVDPCDKAYKVKVCFDDKI
ncbi:hypothetical protein KR093_004556, partial [Drosophila rubida]